MITPLSSPPSRQDPANFPARADTFLGELPTFATEANALAADVNAKQILASQAAAQAQAAADAAQGAVTNYKGIWNSGVTYAQGDSVLYNEKYWLSNINANLGNTPVEGANWTSITDNKSYSKVLLTSPRYSSDNDGTISGGTWAIDYNNGPLIKATVGAAITTITLSNLPASGTVGHLKLMLVNPGAYAITFPAAWKFIKSDFTTTNFAGLGITLPASGVVFFDLITEDAGSNVYVTISRN